MQCHHGAIIIYSCSLGDVLWMGRSACELGYIWFVLQGLKARGNVEDWLGKVEDAMFSNLRRLVKYSISDYERKEREEWVLCHASQVSNTTSSLLTHICQWNMQL